MKRNQGFTLIELMIVIAIIAIVASIAIPELLEARLESNYSAMVARFDNLGLDDCVVFKNDRHLVQLSVAAKAVDIDYEASPPGVHFVFKQMVTLKNPETGEEKTEKYSFYVSEEDVPESFSREANPLIESYLFNVVSMQHGNEKIDWSSSPVRMESVQAVAKGME